MLCEECGKNEASFSITLTSGDEVTTRHLCGDCMKKMNLSLAQGDIQSFLSSLLSMLGNAQVDDSPVCGGCGLHYSAFESTGKLGCAQCYGDFATQLKPLLQRIHGCTQHMGHTPGNVSQPLHTQQLSGGLPTQSALPEDAAAQEAPGSLTKINQRELLRQKMDEAVACENFEDAAKYRDELRQLPVEGEIAP